ncbi:rubredoxin [Candidatus Endoriftia persephonae]|jgi:rubredoxin|uniref:Rubredoxin n=4 Tax=Gammaproteobacteria TaxID=1236 RepID=G2FF93_9GAMM|nr:rubredoxin [Candidatus Endoriftia persephone]EGV52294.1 rubredoxin [endosymbiont of Riftia pachyptila (vent Ph05)]EGW54471.1 rubredoxin [endosymbiont of Tevnia jerichonana (vent Tica)]KRT55460.1 Rubredoxin [endosymbiont of Ridgeia piscesae]KRT60142.1 Rubredoxin [endosymbiont of Ridgeia piscesae]USF89009.1 rubredoxin [Candidatus Endoriftia persephone]
MNRYECEICGWVYDEKQGMPEKGIPPGTPLDQIPEEWVCPDCGADKDVFNQI